MKRIQVGWLLCCAWVAQAAPELEPAAFLSDGTNLLTAGTMSAPSVVDWNNDGKKDLLVGQFDQGRVWLYLNRGTDASPVFNGATPVLSGGTQITTSYG
jgi:hypothetical protein